LSSAPLPRRLAAEFFGTFVFVLAGAGSAVGSASLVALNSGILLLVSALGNGIGLALLGSVLVAGNLTGAALNPARALGPMKAGGFYPGYWYIYVIGPVVGAILAALVYRYLLENPNQ